MKVLVAVKVAEGKGVNVTVGDLVIASVAISAVGSACSEYNPHPVKNRTKKSNTSRGHLKILCRKNISFRDLDIEYNFNTS